MTELHPLAAAYLQRLRRAGRRLPRAVLRDLAGEIEAHLSEATDVDMSDPEVLTVLDRLGEPEAIIDAQQPVIDSRSTREWAAIFLLLFGGFVFGIGWIAGLILLWSSRAWNLRDKWVGTLIWPGGLAAGLFFASFVLAGSAQVCSSGPTVISVGGKTIHRAGAMQCSGGPSTGGLILAIVILAALVLAPVATSIYLARRATQTTTQQFTARPRPEY